MPLKATLLKEGAVAFFGRAVFPSLVDADESLQVIGVIGSEVRVAVKTTLRVRDENDIFECERLHECSQIGTMLRVGVIFQRFG
jgi:hypothetical protein